MGFWPFGKKAPPLPERTPVLTSEIPAERYGPAPPPPPTPQTPGVVRHRFGESVEVAAGGPRAAQSAVLTLAAGAAHVSAGGSGFVVLSGLVEPEGLPPLGPGDSLIATAGLTLRSLAGAVLLADVAAPGPGEARRFGRDDLAGRGFPGITGIRAVHRTPHAALLRLGPPPGVRWVLVGVRTLAVFTGKLTVLGGDEPLDVRGGELLTIADPTATLYLQAGNDSALAIGFSSPDVIVALG